MTAEKEPKKVVTRFAPSPTGFMHVGGVRTALFAWLFAKKNNGTFILRIEDTDKDREVGGSISHIIESLKWLGISWNEGPDIGGAHAPYIQSERLNIYKKYAEKLIKNGFAYADPFTSEELEGLRKKSELEKLPFLYRNHRSKNPPKWDGSQALRLKTPYIKSYEWQDAVRGNLSAGLEALDDFILIKSDGLPTYNFAHIIDDLEMGVTHIFRADEFISSMPKFLSLYEALEITPPVFATLPPILGPDGKKKLGKRDGAKDILDYKREGFIPEAMLNFLAFIGWNPGDEREIMTVEEITEAFELSKIHIAPAKFNEEKLLWTNKEYIKKLQNEEVSEKIKEIVKKEDLKIIAKITPLIKEKISKFSDIEDMARAGELDYFFEAPEIDKSALICPEKLCKVKASSGDITAHLKKIIELLQPISENDFTAEKTKSSIWDYATERGRGVVLWAMRFALSGKEKSPDPFMLCGILGKEESLSRLRHAAL